MTPFFVRLLILLGEKLKTMFDTARLAGKSAIITGGGTGIGRGVTPKFAPTRFITGLGTHQFDGRLCLATEQTPRTPKS